MRKILLLVLTTVMVCMHAMAQSAEIQNVTFFTDGNVNWLKMKVTFVVSGCKDREIQLAAFMAYQGNDLPDYNGRYGSTTNCVAVSKNLCPGYEATQYTEEILEIPISELHLGDGLFTNITCHIYVFTGGNPVYIRNAARCDINMSGGNMQNLIIYRANGWKDKYERSNCYGCYDYQTGRYTGNCVVCKGSGRTPAFYGTQMYSKECQFCHGSGACQICYRSLALMCLEKNQTPNGGGGSGYSGGGFSGGYSGGSNSSNGSYSNGGSSSSKRQSTRTCPMCNGSGKGSDQIVYEPNYSGQDNSRYCSTCGYTQPAHSHRRPNCVTCNGTGVVSN